jgi:hypothetical protein
MGLVDIQKNSLYIEILLDGLETLKEEIQIFSVLQPE